MNILVTGVSGIGKTTLLNKVREDFSREMVIIMDADHIGYRNREQKWNISEKAVKGLREQKLGDLIIFGVSDNIREIANLFDVVICMTGPITEEQIKAVTERENERNKRKGHVANPDNLNKKIMSLKNASKELDPYLPIGHLKVSNDDAYKLLQKLARNARIGENSK